jgi:hypothetical protein
MTYYRTRHEYVKASFDGELWCVQDANDKVTFITDEEFKETYEEVL